MIIRHTGTALTDIKDFIISARRKNLNNYAKFFRTQTILRTRIISMGPQTDLEERLLVQTGCSGSYSFFEHAGTGTGKKLLRN
jgi:hypothetical protein